MTSDLNSRVIREVVREVLREVVAEEVAAVAGTPSVALTHSAAQGEHIVIRSQADLDRAVRRVLEDSRQGQRRRAIEVGEVRFVLASDSSAAGTRPRSPDRSVHRFERGALTERHVQAAAKAEATIHITSRVVITPLARERARSLGIEIHREG